MSNHPGNNKTISNKIREEYKSPYTSYIVVISLGFGIIKTPQTVLPDSPNFSHRIISIFFVDPHTSSLVLTLPSDLSFSYRLDAFFFHQTIASSEV